MNYFHFFLNSTLFLDAHQTLFKVVPVNFDIIQAVSKDGVSGFFINEPLEKLGIVAAQRISYGKPDINSYFIFKFYEAILDPEGKFVDATPIDVRLMKENKDGIDVFVGGYLEKELSHHHKWKLTDNIFFAKPGTSSDYIKFKEVLASDGRYYIDLLYNGDLYRYYFEVKGGVVITELSDKSKPGSYWMEREFVSIPKYDGYRPTVKTAGVADNIRIMVKTGTSSRGYSPGKPVVFTDGQKVSCNLSFKDNIKTKYMNRLVENIITLKKGDKIIGQTISYSVFNGYSSFPNLVMDPEKDIIVSKKAFTSFFMQTLSQLPAGTHKLKLVYELASGKDNNLVGIRTITYKSKTGNPIFTEWAKQTQEQLEMSDAERGNLRFLRSPTFDWVYYDNNCGTIVWLRQDEYKEYHLYSGDMGKFDRAGGPLEQWNFGTWKWNPINDFKPYKTVYVLGQNELAMLEMKQVPKDAIEKLRAIQDKEFKTLDAFLSKVKSLIGEELASKNENLIVGTASVEFVKICH